MINGWLMDFCWNFKRSILVARLACAKVLISFYSFVKLFAQRSLWWPLPPARSSALQRCVLFFNSGGRLAQGPVDGLTATDKHTNLCRQSADGVCYGSEIDIGAACTSWPCCICTTTEKEKGSMTVFDLFEFLWFEYYIFYCIDDICWYCIQYMIYMLRNNLKKSLIFSKYIEIT